MRVNALVLPHAAHVSQEAPPPPWGEESSALCHGVGGSGLGAPVTHMFFQSVAGLGLAGLLLQLTASSV